MNLATGQQAARHSAQPRGDAYAAGAALLALAPIALIGSPTAISGLVVAAGSALALLGVLVATGGKAADVLSGRALPLAAFGLALFMLALALTPLAPGGVHPLWEPAGGAGAAVLDRQTGLEGLLSLAGLGALFILGAVAAQRIERARALAFALQTGLFAAQVGLLVLAAIKITDLDTYVPVYPAGLLPLVSGLTLLLAVSTIVQTAKARKRPGRFSWFRDAPFSMMAAALSALELMVSAGSQALVAMVSALATFAAWEFLARSGKGSLRPGPLLVALGLTGLTVVSLGGAIIVALGPTPHAPHAIADAVHARMAWASPWLGYGPGTAEAVGRMAMDRLTLPALSETLAPTSGYLLALEQGGALVFLPVAVAIVSVLVTVTVASVRRRRLTTLYRVVGAGLLFSALMAIALPAPMTVAGAAPLVLLLGCGFGAAGASR